MNGRRGIYLSPPLTGMTDTWSEKCANCGALCGDKVFTDEAEFDEHPDREIGYNGEGDWLCPDCRDDTAVPCDCCGKKVPEGDLEIVDGWDWCPWCVARGGKEEEKEEEEEIIFNCSACDVGIIKNSPAHDSALTYNGKVWWCLECYDSYKAELAPEEE